MERRYIVFLIAAVAIGSVLLSQAKGRYHTVDGSTYLQFEGCLENKNTGKAIRNVVVRLAGAGLPRQVSTDDNGNLSVSSSSPEEQIQIQMVVAGYEPYSLTVPRRMVKMECFQCDMRQEFLLTPLPRS